MGVSGVQQFKQNLTQAKQAVKTLDAQLALTEKQFKQTGDSESYMAEKSALLDEKLENQKKILENTEKALEQMRQNGVDRSSKAYQDMYRQMVQAKSEIIDTENAMNGMTDAGDKASDAVSEMNSQLAGIGKGVAWDNVTNGLESITSSMENVIKKAWKVGEAIVNATLGAGSWADELKTTAAQYEIDPEDLQRWRKTANIIDTDVDTILTAQDKLKKGREQADKETMGALAYLGVDPTGKSDLDVFWETGEAIARLGKEEDKVYYAQKAFGKSWRELLPLFQAGREEWDKTNSEWSVVENDQLDKLGKMDDAYQKMQGEWETFKNELLSAFAGPLTEGMDTITALFKELNEYLDTPEGQAMLKQIGDTVSQLISDLVNIKPEDVINSLKGIIDGITDAFKWIEKNKDSVKTALEVIAGGFVALKLGEVATNIGKIVNGFTTLWNGANKKLPTMPGTPTGSPTGGNPTNTGTGGNGGLKTWLTGAGASIKSFFSMNGLSALTPAAAAILAIAPAEFARHADEARWKEQQERWSAAGEKLTGGDREYVLAAARTMEDVYRPNGIPYDYLMGLQDRSDLQKMQLHNMVGSDTWTSLMEFWRTGGENMADFQVTQLFQDVADAYTKMAEQTEDVTGATEKQTESNKELTDAAAEMKKLPDLAATAVKNALNGSKVVIDGNELSAVVGTVMAGMLARYQTQ
jgi:methyl-accepting chemotaxis protein